MGAGILTRRSYARQGFAWMSVRADLCAAAARNNAIWCDAIRSGIAAGELRKRRGPCLHDKARLRRNRSAANLAGGDLGAGRTMRQFEMTHEIIEAGKEGARLRLDNRALDRLAGEFADRRERIPQSDGDEFHRVAACRVRRGPFQQIGTAMPLDRGQGYRI